ncbi:Z-ring formation inhibitor MciZ [Neobacillus sp. LXY-4]
MKIYVHDKGFVLVGKAWEIKRKIAEYRRRYELMIDWAEDITR